MDLFMDNLSTEDDPCRAWSMSPGCPEYVVRDKAWIEILKKCLQHPWLNGGG